MTDEPTRTAVCDGTNETVYEERWDYGFQLSCGHTLKLGNARSFTAAQRHLDAMPRGKSGWYLPLKCWACRMRRRVVHSFSKLERGGGAA